MRACRHFFSLGLLMAGAVLPGCGRDTGTLGVETEEPLYEEGKQLERQGRTQEALADFLKLISRRGEQQAPESHFEAGLIELQDVKDPIAAIYHFRKFLELEPNSQIAPGVRDQIEVAKREFASSILIHGETEAEGMRGRAGQAAGELAGPPDAAEQIARLESENARLIEEITALRGAGAPAMHPAAEEPAPEAAAAPVLVPVANAARPAQAAQGAPALPALTPAPVSAHAARTHVVARGDTLYNLSLRYYGTGSHWKEIQAANRDALGSGANPPLRVGLELKIP